MTEVRIAKIERATRETKIELELGLDGGAVEVATGIPFLDHMLEGLAKHGNLSIRLRCRGDLEVDDHHSAEDCAIALGSALDEALGERRGVVRFGSAYAPLDEALVRSVVDLSGRPFSLIDLPLARESIGGLSCENVSHFLHTFATSARMTLHVDLIRGINDHHKIEAAFKSLALALRAAVAMRGDEIMSTKGVL